MPNYYLVVERVGKGCDVDVNGRLKHWDLPSSWGFKSPKDALRLRPGDRLVGYVAPRWGFALDLEVGEWETRSPLKTVEDGHKEYPFRRKVSVKCEVKERDLMPKWKNLWPKLNWCRGMSAKRAALTLRPPLLSIDKDDYELIAGAVCRAANP